MSIFQSINSIQEPSILFLFFALFFHTSNTYYNLFYNPSVSYLSAYRHIQTTTYTCVLYARFLRDTEITWAALCHPYHDHHLPWEEFPKDIFIQKEGWYPKVYFFSDNFSCFFVKTLSLSAVYPIVCIHVELSCRAAIKASQLEV